MRACTPDRREWRIDAAAGDRLRRRLRGRTHRSAISCARIRRCVQAGVAVEATLDGAHIAQSVSRAVGRRAGACRARAARGRRWCSPTGSRWPSERSRQLIDAQSTGR